MIFAMIGLATGALVGGTLAARRKGSRADILQYAAGYAILFGLLGLVLAILVVRMGS